jgi:hypothetical protein
MPEPTWMKIDRRNEEAVILGAMVWRHTKGVNVDIPEDGDDGVWVAGRVVDGYAIVRIDVIGDADAFALYLTRQSGDDALIRAKMYQIRADALIRKQERDRVCCDG